MTFEHIDAFLAAVRYPTFFDAAESLHITQSALSKQIKRLEEELDQPLFERDGRSVRLTGAGKLFYEEAQTLSRQYRQALARMEDHRRRERASLCIGTLPILSQYGITGLLSRFSDAHPELSLRIEEREEEELLSGFSRGEFDLAVCRDLFLDREQFDFLCLAEDRLGAILPKGHPLAKDAEVTLSELAAYPLILMPPYTSICRLCLQLFKENGLRPNLLRTARMESILSAVALGEAVSLFAGENFRLFRFDSVVSVPLKDSPVLKTGVAFPRAGRLSSAAKKFLQFLETRPIYRTQERTPAINL